MVRLAIISLILILYSGLLIGWLGRFWNLLRKHPLLWVAAIAVVVWIVKKR